MLRRICPSIPLFLVSELLLLYFFPAHLIFKSSLSAGGDTPIHFLSAVAMSKAHCSLFSPVTWENGAFGGFPLFLNYFPLPFELMALIARVCTIEIAFKLVTLLAILPLPAAVYFCLRRLGYSRSTPGIGALLSALFLLTTKNSMWGANICSTLAGEFAYGISFILYVIFTGKLYSDIYHGRSWLSCSILEASMALCSGYPPILAAMGSSYFIARGGRLKYLLRLHAAAAGLTAFWLLPMLWRLPWTTAYSFSWYFHSWQEIAPPLLWPSIAGALMLPFIPAPGRSRGGWKIGTILKESIASPELYLFWQFCAALVGFSLAAAFGLVDARFLPLAQIAIVLLGAPGWERLLTRLPKPTLWLTGFCAATLILGLTSAPVVNKWIRWNYSGMETKPLWNSYRQVNDYLKGDENSPRVAAEHNAINNGAGTIRAFELLPFFSGRSTLAGLYMQSALNAPFVYYLQSEISSTPSCPLEQYYSSRPDPSGAAKRMRLFNVSQVVTVSADMTDALSLSPDYELLQTFAPYAIFRIRGCSGSYVEPLRYKPLRISPRNWKKVQFEWLRKSSLKVPLIVASRNSPGDFWKKLSPYGGDPGQIPAIPLAGSQTVTAKAFLHRDTITIATSKPGFPLWIKIAYHPDWHVTKGRGELYPASPAFMLLVPKTSHVVLTFDTRSGIYLLGKLLFFLTILGLAIGYAVTRRPRPPMPEVKSSGDAPPSQTIAPENARLLFSFALMAAILAAGVFNRNYRDPVLFYQLLAARFERSQHHVPLLPPVHHSRREGSVAASPPTPEDLQLLGLLDACAARFGHSTVLDNCEAYKARVMAEYAMWEDLRPMLEQYIQKNPDSRMYAQALFWLGQASYATGRREDAERFFLKTLFTWPPNEAVNAAGLALAKIAGPHVLLKTAQDLFTSGRYLEAYNIYLALTFYPDETTRQKSILALGYCDFRLNRLQDGCDLLMRWLGPNFNAPQSERVKADLQKWLAVIACNRKSMEGKRKN
ncbi:MAG: 6-pyruvoyl-tetrahydropterin synthase-related protein [Syntrophobacteraceae bacterium]